MVCAGCVVGVMAQGTDVDVSSDILYITNRDNANYDSLLTSYYFKKYAKQIERHYDHHVTQAYDNFDDIADSVLARRLNKLPFVIPMSYNANVRAYIRTYVRIMERRCDVMLTLSELYFPMFEEVLDKYGMPHELKYLTIVESALNPQATSRAGAAGLWQFMYRTGKNYDLEVNSLVDDRRDPYKSTDAAARYLRDLYGIYHDWLLAMAAYNCGPGNINKAIARAGGAHDFWKIYDYLPRETRGYIPAFIGACYAMNYYHEHGIKPQHINIPIQRDTVHLKHDALYCFISQYTGVEVDELRALNPQYRVDRIPVRSGHNVITFPASKIQILIRMEDSIYVATRDSLNKKPAVTTAATIKVYHKVKRGETMSSIASRYGVTVAQLKKWNKRKSTTVKAGERLLIYRRNPNYVATTSEKPSTKVAPDSTQHATPDTSAVVGTATVVDSEAESESKQQSTEVIRYTVKKGDTLSSIAKRYGTTVNKLMKTNHLNNATIRIGQVLTIEP